VVYSEYGPAEYLLNDTVVLTGTGYGNITIIAPVNTEFQMTRVVSIPDGFKYDYNSGVVYGTFNITGQEQFEFLYNVHGNYTRVHVNMGMDVAKILAATREVYTNYTYTTDFDDYTRTITNILSEKSGSCVAFSRGLNHILRSMDISTDYVYGYSHTTGVHHLWLVYLNNNTHLEVDPTYGEVGLLSNDHISFGHSPNPQLTDLRITYFGNVTAEHTIRVKQIYSRKYNQDVRCNFSYSNGSITIVADTTNPSGFMFENIGVFNGDAIKGPVFRRSFTRFPVHLGQGVYILNLSAKYNDVVCRDTLTVGADRSSVAVVKGVDKTLRKSILNLSDMYLRYKMYLPYALGLIFLVIMAKLLFNSKSKHS